MKRFFFIVFLTCFHAVVLAQGSYSLISDKADAWYQATTISKPLVKGAKEKTLDYPKQQYSVKGVFIKGALAEGYNVEVYETQSEPNLILKGRVSYTAGKLTVTGAKFVKTEKGQCIIYGTFFVSNGSNNTMIYKPNKAKEIVITDDYVEYYKGYYNHCPAIISLGIENYISVDGTGNENYNYFTAPLDKSVITKIGYNKIDDLLLATDIEAQMELVDKTGSITHFNGTVQPYKTANNDINFDLLDGSMEGVGNKVLEKEVSVIDGTITMEIIYDSNLSSVSKEIIVVNDKPKIDDKHYWDEKIYYENLSEITYEFSNEDKYVGLAIYPPLENNSKTSCTMSVGKYKYSNGDSFEGDLSKGLKHGIYTSGTTYFCDGTSLKDDWLSEFILTDKQYADLSNLHFPSSIRNTAITFEKDNEYNRFISRAKKEAIDGYYEDALSYYLAAKDVKSGEEIDSLLFNCYLQAGQAAEKRGNYELAKSYCEDAKVLKPSQADAIKKIEEKLDDKIFYEEMIAKYGKATGEKIASGEISIGMTKQMVYDALKDDVVRHSYRINKTESTYAKTERWYYDYDVAKKYMSEQSGSGQLVFEGVMALTSVLGSLMGLSLEDEFSKKVEYKYLEFRNDKLVEFRNNSIYEDDDDLLEDISTLWILGNMF